jgi:hypothetical protein
VSTYDAERIEKPSHFQISPLKRGRGNRRVQVIGFDSEQDTTDATPMLYQFSSHGEAEDTELFRVAVKPKTEALDVFMRYVHRTCTRKDTEYIIVGFNLQYEFTQIFGNLPPDLNTLDEYEFRYVLEDRAGNRIASYVVHVMSVKRFGVVFTNEATHRRIRFMDAHAFYTTSLDNAAAMLDIGRKVVMSSKRFTRASLDDPLFIEYAKQDAYLTRRIGENIIELHETFDVPTCITAPHFASRVFRRHFLTRTVALPDPDLEQAGLWSYHGGKNGYYLNEPKHLTNLYAYDITSAYPEAMRQLPDIERSTWEWCEKYEPGVAALWWIRAKYKSCKYRGIMQHKNEWQPSGEIEGWTTSYELDATIAEGEIEILESAGWVMRGAPGGPLVKYVDTFFEMKRTATGAKRNAAKLFLNSLYGKFFQKVALGVVGYYDAETLDELGQVRYIETDPSQMFDYQAGGLYHPPIASLITGYVRAKMHRLEHRYGAIMTSTDGFFAVKKPDPADVGTDLGKLTVERGDLSIWRERLYDFKPHAIGSKSKFALHGFRGTVEELRRIPLTVGAYSYTAQQVITNKLAPKSYRGRRFRAGTFALLEFRLDLTNASHAPP